MKQLEPHVKHIYKKIGVVSASEAVIKSMNLNL
jgi:DNA-binding CsgD family transcriptional regulator